LKRNRWYEVDAGAFGIGAESDFKVDAAGCTGTMMLRGLIRRLKGSATAKSAEDALALNRRGEARRDGLDLISATQSLDVAWAARGLHPWDRGQSANERDRLFTEQCYADTDAALQRLFLEFPEVDSIRFRVLHPESDEQLLAGSVNRSKVSEQAADVSARTRLWQMGVRVSMLLVGISTSLVLMRIA
jgi:hypothetical protein